MYTVKNKGRLQPI